MEQKQKFNNMKVKEIIILIGIFIFLSCANSEQSSTEEQDNIVENEMEDDKMISPAIEDSIYLGISFQSFKEFNDFDIVTKPKEWNGIDVDELIASKRLSHFLNTKDSIFYIVSGISLSLKKENVYIGCFTVLKSNISTEKKDKKWLFITNKKGENKTLSGVLDVNKGVSYSVGCEADISANKYCSTICLGEFQVKDKVEMWFKISEIYGVTWEGRIEKLPLTTILYDCPVPDEYRDEDNESTPYFFSVQDGKKYTRFWNE